MQMSPAMVRLFLTISSGGRLVFSSSARAADWAKAPPEPMAAMPSSGSSTSPLPVMISECSRSATASIASRRRSMRSVRQSLASSTALRIRCPECLSSLASKRSNSVKASAVPPANPASTFSWYRRRTLRAVDLMTMLPSVTWPSPPRATSVPRRTERMVVPRYCSMRLIIDALSVRQVTARVPAGATSAAWSEGTPRAQPEGPADARSLAGVLRPAGLPPPPGGSECGPDDEDGGDGRTLLRVAGNELRQLVDAHDAKEFVDERVVAAQGNGLAAAQALHQHADELTDAAVIDPGDLGQIHQHFVMRGGIAAELLQGAVVGGRDFAGQLQGVVHRFGGFGLHHFGGLHLAP